MWCFQFSVMWSCQESLSSMSALLRIWANCWELEKVCYNIIHMYSHFHKGSSSYYWTGRDQDWLQICKLVETEYTLAELEDLKFMWTKWLPFHDLFISEVYWLFFSPQKTAVLGRHRWMRRVLGPTPSSPWTLRASWRTRGQRKMEWWSWLLWWDDMHPLPRLFDSHPHFGALSLPCLILTPTLVLF